MKCRGIDLEAIPAVEEKEVEEEEEVDQTAICELEAAEALAGMARDRPLRLGSGELARPPLGTGTTSLRPSQAEKDERKIRAEKEERKIRRILANRESARQTIRRRKAMHLELTRKAADVLEENENLKKEKEVAVDEYNSLKGQNEFLKAQLAKAKKVVRGMQDEATTSSSERTCPTNTPFVMHNQVSTVPYLWPPILPSLEVYQFQCAPGSGSNLSSSSHFPMPCPSMMPCPYQGQENSTKTNSQRPQLFILAVPWLVPSLAHGTPSDFNLGTDTTQNSHLSLPHEDNYNQLSSNGNMNARVTPISSRPVEILRPSRNAQADDSSGARVGSAPESIRHNSIHKNQEPLKNAAEDAFTATVARKRRKELMKMKNFHWYYNHLRFSAPG